MANKTRKLIPITRILQKLTHNIIILLQQKLYFLFSATAIYLRVARLWWAKNAKSLIKIFQIPSKNAKQINAGWCLSVLNYLKM